MRARFTFILSLGFTTVVAAAGGVYLSCGYSFAREEAIQVAPVTLPTPPMPPRIAGNPEYVACLGLLPEDPAAAWALIRTQPGDLVPIQHCQALAMVAEGRLTEGAALLENLADAPGLSDTARTVLLGQAAEAWFAARGLSSALRAASKASRLTPNDTDTRLRHARVASRLGLDRDAVADLTFVLQAIPDHVDALRERAVAWRRLERADQARADINHAARLAPDDPEVLLERGIQRQRAGDLIGARADWRQVMVLEPDSEAADLAEQNLALLEAGGTAR